MTSRMQIQGKHKCGLLARKTVAERSIKSYSSYCRQRPSGMYAGFGEIGSGEGGSDNHSGFTIA